MARSAKKKKAPVKAKSSKKMAKKAVKTGKKVAKPKASKPAKKANSTKAVKATPKAKTLDVGSIIPDFAMPATKIGEVSATKLKGKPFVLYFYPKDDTSGCTAEACEFRNNISQFERVGATVIGVSKDSMESHDKFGRKYSLNFPLASDENSKVCEAFGTWTQKSMYGRTYMGIERSTFLVDSKGTIRAVWRKVSVSGHVDEVKKAMENL